MNFENKAVLITGASRGLGAALARELAGRGARVALVARDGPELAAVVGQIRAAGGEAHAIVADVADKQAVLPIAGSASAVLGPIDLLVHNASSLGPVPMRDLLDTDCEDLEAALATNLVGPFRLSKALAGPMVLRGSGTIVHITSDAAVRAYPGWGAYGASKAALDHLSRIWAAELQDTGVRFLAIDPGEMNTRMHADAMPEADPATLADPADVARSIAGRLARIDAPESGSRLELAAEEVAS
ncbi:MAG: SDR family oxidoreductase [Candidatus Wallbacteria bacterium]|nr:SDR family oxidoreductase [Candidatus Wallbacteria bacterium]